ncbi:nucleoside triphosphate pyrophosphohydrolase family protein [Aeromicrobium endophyticum]|uniref:Nucleotide pyrophosphohydrolase n=1 Tax=Aeromicrobium endophyticum TaxID=2292704 RepID=A0A371P3G0_9ACTN|nr:nucleoside triphosphate pyrophosphohydrolase family protein [Aeromicrobium endophyticum]REK70477.1 nucleotide pyrophosphohydrolase [Aeromicrobium endophyticum]
MNIGEYQRLTAETDVLDPTDLGLPLLGLAGEVGNLSAEYKKRQRDQAGYRAFSEEVHEELGDLIWYAAALARRCDLDLDEVLADNLRKTKERFLRPDTPPPHPLFDEGRDPSEQIPRSFDITFVETIEHDRGREPVPVVRIYRGTNAVGDPLDDNSDDSDDYRYHDALHLGHLAVLGWSPTMRGLLDVKRSSDRDLDRVQDGGRSAVVEEGLTAYVFSVAVSHSLFATSDRVPIDVIKACQKMTAHLEVSRRSAMDWEYAILAGYRVFRELQHHHGGTVHVDLNDRSLTFTAPRS